MPKANTPLPPSPNPNPNPNPPPQSHFTTPTALQLTLSGASAAHNFPDITTTAPILSLA